MSSPRVTVGVPVYNGAKYISNTLEALRSQSLADIQVVVADNASTDGTLDVVRGVVGDDPRFEILTSEVNRGIPWNFNRLVDAARAPHFMWNGADDWVRATHLERCAALLDAHPEANIAFSRVILVDSKGEEVGQMDDEGLDFATRSPSERVGLFFERNVYQVIGFGGVIRTDVLRAAGKHPARYGGDLQLAVKLAMAAPWVQVPEQLYVSRRHDEQMNKTQGGDVIDQMRVYRPDWSRPVTFPQWSLTAAMVRETLTAPVPITERLAAAAQVVRRWLVPNWRMLAFDVKRNLVRLARGRYRGAYHSE